MEILNLHILSLMIAVVAFVYSDVLTEPGMILNWLYKKIDLLPSYISKPLIGCFKCVAGQMALWYYTFGIQDYDWRLHVYFVCLTILLSQIVCRIYRAAS